MQLFWISCNKKAHPGMNALSLSVIRLRRTRFESEVKSV